ncbi:MAG TPA: hypothetical protein VK206_11695, partial [Anaerolineales bacterium]|nr:hypothetical protein [Anaerolineales bacterium]
MEFWKAITYVSSPLTLVAFLAAVVAWVYVSQLKRIENLINSAKDSDRKVLLEGVLDVLRLKVDNLSQSKRFELAAQHLHGRALKLKLAFCAFLVLAIGMLALSAFAIFQQPAAESVKDLMEGERKNEAIAALKKLQIYPIADSDLPRALSELVRLDKNELKLGVLERTQRMRDKIDANPSVAELRRRAEKTEAPFERLGLKLIAGVPKIGPDQPGRFYVNVPIGADYAWKRLRIINPITNEEIRVIARPAIDDQIRDVDIHVNYQQAAKLFGSQIPERTKEVWVQVLGPG